jgi:L-fuculose-phosphate aldolase
MLGCIRDNDLVKMGIEDDTDRGIALASSELGVHRAIYRETPALAIVHAHLPHATALSMVEREIVPRDVEGCSLFNKVAVVGWGMKLGPGELAAEIAMALRKNVIILVHGHGSFARGEILEEAYHVTSALEQSCHLLWLLMALKAGSSSPAEHGS